MARCLPDRLSARGRPRLRRHPPDRVADIVGDQQRSLLVDTYTDRAPLCFALVIEEAGQHILRLARGLAVLERDKDHLVAGARLAIPGAVLADERAARHFLRKQISGIESK